LPGRPPGYVAVVDDNAIVKTIPVSDDPDAIAASASGAYVWVTSATAGGSGEVTVISTASQSVVGTATVTAGAPLAIAVSPTTGVAYVTAEGLPFEGPARPVSVLAFSLGAGNAVQQLGTSVSDGFVSGSAIAISANGAYAYVTSNWYDSQGQDDSLWLYSTQAIHSSAGAQPSLLTNSAFNSPAGIAVVGDQEFISKSASGRVDYAELSPSSGGVTVTGTVIVAGSPRADRL
jgi:DNA-binding beta-propeller fold protein YncE